MSPLLPGQAVGEAVGGVGGVSDHPGPHQAGGRGGYILHTGGRGRIVDPDVAQTLPQGQTVFRIGVGQPSLHKQYVMRVPCLCVVVIDSKQTMIRKTFKLYMYIPRVPSYLMSMGLLS